MSHRIGLYGGSFNPIHLGHLITSRAVAEQLNLSKIVLIPAASPPHKNVRDLAPAEHRVAMAQLAVQGDPLFEVSAIELQRSGPSYTFDTVERLRTELGESAELFWLIGADTLPELATWHRTAELVKQVQIVTMVRPGLPEPDLQPLARVIGTAAVESLLAARLMTPAIEISATDIRRRVAGGSSIRYLTPDPVARYIEQHRLFFPT